MNGKVDTVKNFPERWIDACKCIFNVFIWEFASKNARRN